jgi:hypothetical protein
MKLVLTAFMALVPAVLAQDSPEVIKRVQIRADRMTAAAGATFAYVAGELVGGNPVKGAPYSAQAVTETSQTLADGNHISHSSSSMIYRDSLGRERREQSIAAIGMWKAQGDPPQIVMISDPVAGVNYELNPKTRTAHKMPVPSLPPGMAKATAGPGVPNMIYHAAPFELPLPPPSTGAGPQVMIFKGNVDSGSASAPKTEDLGTETVEGVLAQGTRTTVTIAAGEIGNERPLDIVSERWYSPDLKVTVMSKQTDPRSGETIYRLTQINRSEPLHSLFEVPADYTLVDSPVMSFGTVQAKPEE